MDDDGGVYANTYLPFTVDPAEYTGKRVLAVPRCCQKRKGTQDRMRVNDSVAEKDQRYWTGNKPMTRFIEINSKRT